MKLNEPVEKIEYKFCMQCDDQSQKWPDTRRCSLCGFLTCRACKPDGEKVCNHCKRTRVEMKEV